MIASTRTAVGSLVALGPLLGACSLITDTSGTTAGDATATGGAPAVGGRTAAGGATASGGRSAVGGRPASGGRSIAGGRTSRGGSAGGWVGGGRSAEDGVAGDPAAGGRSSRGGSAGQRATGGMGAIGPTPGEDAGPCQTTVHFEKEGWADPTLSENMDCITPDVCITRGDSESLYNAVVDAASPGGCIDPEPSGTLWIEGPCSERMGDDLQLFGPFMSNPYTSCLPSYFVGTPACLYLPDHGLFFDIRLESWTEEGGGFSYTRTTAIPCGVPGAECVESGDPFVCDCPPGYAPDPSDGFCHDVDECAAGVHRCHDSATCVDRPGTYNCECGPIEFELEDGADPALPENWDCITPDVCLTRAGTLPLYNVMAEREADTSCSSEKPTGTLWSFSSCDGPKAFSPFMGGQYSYCNPLQTVGIQGCLWVPEPDYYLDVELTSWSREGSGFSYVRSHFVALGEACP